MLLNTSGSRESAMGNTPAKTRRARRMTSRLTRSSLLAAAILREKLTPRLFFGAALISAGVVLVSLS